MKKFLSVLLFILLLIFSIFSVAAGEYTSGIWKYTIQGDGTVVIVSGSGSSTITNETIPSMIEDRVVAGIGENAFYKFESLTSVTIPESIRSIRANPFAYCKELSEIIVSPDHPYLATIDGVLFSKSDKRLVCYPGAFKSLFYEIPRGIQSIAENAFHGNRFLESITIPNTVTSIGGASFSNSHLKSIEIPDSVMNIGNHAFQLSLNLESVTLSDNLVSIGTRAFDSCVSLLSIQIPDSVRDIGESAFGNCKSLYSVKISSSLTKIGKHVFADCQSLHSVIIPDSVESIGYSAFSNCSAMESITIPDSVVSIGEAAFWGCLSLTSITIPDSVTHIGKHAFKGCSSLVNITIPDSVTSIGEGAFDGCHFPTVTVSRDSYAKQYCEQNGINYTYTDANNDWLND